jgi:hypothetical protein
VATCDPIAEGRLLGNVVDALRQALDERPDGCLEARLWHGAEVCFVSRRVFDEAVECMVSLGWARCAPVIGWPADDRSSTALTEKLNSLGRQAEFSIPR